MISRQEIQPRLSLSLNNKMSRDELKNAIDTAKQYMQDLKLNGRINPLIAEIVYEALKYAKETFCASGTISGLISRSNVKDNRYDIVNKIFNLGDDSTKSLEHEKYFFTVVQQELMYITDKKSDLRSHCLWRTLNNENALIRELEDKDPSHRDAVNGIVSASILIGVFGAFVLRNPILLIVAMLGVSAKFISISGRYSNASPSLLGQAVYHEPTIRLAGKNIHDVLPSNLAYRLLSLIQKSSKIGLVVAESTVGRLERIVDPQQRAREFLEEDSNSREMGAAQITERDEDNSYEARSRLMQRR